MANFNGKREKFKKWHMKARVGDAHEEETKEMEEKGKNEMEMDEEEDQALEEAAQERERINLQKERFSFWQTRI